MRIFHHDEAKIDGLMREAWKIEATPDVMMRLKRMFPRANPNRRGAVAMVDTKEVCRDLHWLTTRYDFEMLDEDRALLETRAQEHDERRATVLSLLNGGQSHIEGTLDLARPARDYQLVAADLMLTTGNLLLMDELGLGKSMSGLLSLRESSALPALVVCPTHLPLQWKDELALTLPMLRGYIVRKGTPYDITKTREMKGHDPDVIIMGYGKLRGWGDFLRGKIKTVIFDEAQELRRADSDKYTAAASVADAADTRIGLTATPIYNYGGEIHNILSVLAPDALGSRNEFAREWCGGSRWGDKIRVKDPKALGLHLREQGITLRRTRKEVGRELPEVVRVEHAIDSDKDTFDRLTGEAIDLARLILSKTATQKEQFTARGDFDLKMRQATGIAKAPYVADFVRMLLESDEKVMLLGWHRAVYDTWAERLSDLNPVFYTGTESPAKKQASKEAFVHGDCRLFIMSLRSGAGLDGLEAATHVCVFGELDWSPAMHDQCIGRLHRDGQDESVVAYFLVSENGADPPMAEILQLKRMQSEPMRDPDAKPFEAQPDNSGRIKGMAQAVLRARSRR